MRVQNDQFSMRYWILGATDCYAELMRWPTVPSWEVDNRRPGVENFWGELTTSAGAVWLVISAITLGNPYFMRVGIVQW